MMTPTGFFAATARFVRSLSVFMRLPCLCQPTPLRWPVEARHRTARPSYADLRPTRLFRDRSLNVASCPPASVADDDGFLLFVAVHVLCAEIFAAWFKRVLPFDSYRYAFNAETLNPLPRRGRTLALLFSSPSGVGLLPQNKFGSPSNKNIRAPCEAVALGTLAGKCEPHTRRISEKEHYNVFEPG